MKVPIKWLKDYVEVTLSPAEIANLLTMSGNEVKAVQTIGGSWDKVVIGQIVAINPHPNADRLTLPTINVGNETQTVVCGAPNLKIGDKIAFAYVGAQLYDGHTGEMGILKPAKIRGVVSAGMVCSEKELGISDNHEGILVLPPDAPIGMHLADYLGDSILDLEVTPNRPDCLSVIGIAREVAALTGKSIKLLEPAYEEKGQPIRQQVSINIIDSDLCPRYCASLITGVKVKESPEWLQRRLLACGQRPISNIVDITNYVMLEYGQPLHSFDYRLILGKKINVKRATAGETMVTLDGTSRTLSGDMLVIADEQGSVAVAGVMGGAASEVTDGTTSILLEAASFKPTSIHYTARNLQLPSEASNRFERGISPELTIPALKRATQLILELAGGEAAQGIIDVYPGKQQRNPITLSTAKVKQVLNLDITADKLNEIFTLLGFDCQKNGTEVTVIPPYWRSDIHQTIELVEEVVRVIGYDKIPTSMLCQALPRHNPLSIMNIKNETKTGLIGFGFQEIISFSLVGLNEIKHLLREPHELEPAPLRLSNPMTADKEYLRPNLRTSLLTAFSNNRRHEEGGIRVFEIGRIYLPRANEMPEESEFVCGILGGARWEKSWSIKDEKIDFFDAKGVIEALLVKLNIQARFHDDNDESLSPAKQASVIVEGNKVGVVGEIDPRVLKAFEISEPVFLFELNLTKLLPYCLKTKTYVAVPKFPAVTHDIALVIDSNVSNHEVIEVIRSFSLVTQATLFDVYTGDQVPAGKKSLAYNLTFQSPNHTLTDEEVDRVQQQILDRLFDEYEATLRA